MCRRFPGRYRMSDVRDNGRKSRRASASGRRADSNLRDFQPAKARDAISGWPRGKSTQPGFEVWRFRKVWGYSLLFIWRWEPGPEDIAELDASVAYHEQQQRMVEEFMKMHGWNARHGFFAVQ